MFKQIGFWDGGITGDGWTLELYEDTTSQFVVNTEMQLVHSEDLVIISGAQSANELTGYLSTQVRFTLYDEGDYFLSKLENSQKKDLRLFVKKDGNIQYKLNLLPELGSFEKTPFTNELAITATDLINNLDSTYTGFVTGDSHITLAELFRLSFAQLGYDLPFRFILDWTHSNNASGFAPSLIKVPPEFIAKHAQKSIYPTYWEMVKAATEAFNLQVFQDKGYYYIREIPAMKSPFIYEYSSVGAEAATYTPSDKSINAQLPCYKVGKTRKNPNISVAFNYEKNNAVGNLKNNNFSSFTGGVPEHWALNAGTVTDLVNGIEVNTSIDLEQEAQRTYKSGETFKSTINCEIEADFSNDLDTDLVNVIEYKGISLDGESDFTEKKGLLIGEGYNQLQITYNITPPAGFTGYIRVRIIWEPDNSSPYVVNYIRVREVTGEYDYPANTKSRKITESYRANTDYQKREISISDQNPYSSRNVIQFKHSSGRWSNSFDWGGLTHQERLAKSLSEVLNGVRNRRTGKVYTKDFDFSVSDRLIKDGINFICYYYLRSIFKRQIEFTAIEIDSDATGLNYQEREE